MGQVRTRTVSLNSVLRTPAFRRGFQDYVAGRPPAFDENWTPDAKKTATDKAWAYERGRHFAAWAMGRQLDRDAIPAWFVDRRVNPVIQRAARDALYSGVIR